MNRSKSGSSVPAVCCCLASGMLSSSCCVIQLLLNYTSIGCAGFSALTPYRLHFRLLTGSFLSHLLISQGINKRTITTTLLSLLLMASQDLVATQNHGRFSSIQQVLVQYKLLPSSSISHIPQQQQHQQLAAQKITLHVQGMRCEACAARLKGNLAALDGVDGCSVHFQTKQVDIWSNSSAAVQPEVLLEAVRATDDSYDVRIVSQDCYNTANDKIACPDVKGAATHQH